MATSLSAYYKRLLSSSIYKYTTDSTTVYSAFDWHMMNEEEVLHKLSCKNCENDLKCYERSKNNGRFTENNPNK